MAKPNRKLITSIRETAESLRGGSKYQWNHMGRCNCGHIAQTITGISGQKIHEMAIAREGDWSDQSVDYCEVSGLRIDELITQMLNLGLTLKDISNLEKLSDPIVLSRVKRELIFHERQDVITYLETWADILEEQRVKEAEMILPKEGEEIKVKTNALTLVGLHEKPE